MSEDVTYQAWCEHDGCEWSRETTGGDPETVQNVSSYAMAGHSLATGHHETVHEDKDQQEAEQS